MHDQASHLRQLVLRANRQAAAEHTAPPRLVVLSGGKQGVGCTTLAVNLAVALTAHGCRTVLVDADLGQADAAALCDCSESPDIGDVLAGRHDIHAALQLAPGGVQLVAGTRRGECRTFCTEKALARMMRQIRSLGPHADAVVVDAGHGLDALPTHFWQAADEVLLVTAPDAVAVMDSYSVIKTMLSRSPSAVPLRLLVNFAENATVAADVHRRIDQSCRRFLGIGVALGGVLPADDSAPTAASHAAPLVLSDPHSALAAMIEQLAAQLVEECAASPLRRAA